MANRFKYSIVILFLLMTEVINAQMKPGHPYMGAYFFNSVRSQGCSFLASAGMCVAHTFIWEYIIEASMEQPS